MRASFALLALPVLAAATAVPRNDVSQCNSGSLQCCDSTQSATSLNSLQAIIVGLLGVVVGSLTGEVGFTCSPVTVVGASGTQCSQQSVCCTGNSFNGVIATGCTPVNVNL